MKYATDVPSTADLAAIEREWPLIEAELAVLDAEVAILLAGSRVSELDWRRLRRAERRVLRAAAALAAPSSSPASVRAA